MNTVFASLAGLVGIGLIVMALTGTYGLLAHWGGFTLPGTENEIMYQMGGNNPPQTGTGGTQTGPTSSNPLHSLQGSFPISGTIYGV